MGAFHSLLPVQSQQMRITPKIVQDLQVLQMGSEELAKFLEKQYEENPLLDLSWKPLSPARRVTPKREAIKRGEERDSGLENIGAPAETLEQVLRRQIRLSQLPQDIRGLAEYLTGNLDENGYLAMDLAEISRVRQVRPQDAESALAAIQAMDPPGVGARDLRECLLLQIGRDPDADPLARTIVSEHLDDLGKGRLQRIADKLQVSLQTLRNSLDYIRQLSPRPGLRYDVHDRSYIVPDVEIRMEHGKFAVSFNERHIPGVSVNRIYTQLLHSGESSQTRHYIRQHLLSAKGLLHSLEHRKSTLLRVVTAILEEQREFFERSDGRLKPMTLRFFAERLDLHESTVSRAIQHKYALTERGLLPLKFFFQSCIGTEKGAGESAQNVKEKIRRLIAGENKQAPLSDQQIAELLQDEGIRIARRTVMKYRDEMKIPPSRLRVL